MDRLPAHHAPFAELYRKRGDWINGLAPDPLRRHASAAPHRVALIDRQGPMTYAALDAAVDGLARALLIRGLGPGDRVAIQLPNWREFAIAQQAALRIGAAYVPLLPQLREAEVGFMINKAQVRALVVPAVHKGFDHQAMAETIGVEHIFVVGSSFEDALAETHGDPDWLALAPHADALRIVMFTSGTESRPKGVLHSYNTQYVGLKRHVRYFDLTGDEVVMCASPVGHGTGAVNGVEFALHLGGTVVMMEAWNPAEGLRVMAQSGATMMWGATTFFADLVLAAREAHSSLSAFRYAFTAGSPVPRELAGAVETTLGARLITAYGQSEGQNIAIIRPEDPTDKVTRSDGRFHDCIDWKLVDLDRAPGVAPEAGEIAYRGPNVCLGYIDPAHTAAALDGEGFIYSGDLGVVDADGYLRIVGRRKDIIIRGGENISPAEVEDILFGHPMIAKVSIVGYADARLGQRACAIAIPAPGAEPSLADLIAYMAERGVAKYKFPERLILVDDLPMTASGKVRKDVLRETLLDGAA